MSTRHPECASFIFLSGVSKTYSGKVRAHVLKRHLKRRKENSLVPRPQNKGRASLSNRSGRGPGELAEITSEQLSHETSQANVGDAPDSLPQADTCRASPQSECPSVPGAYRFCPAAGYPLPAIVLLEHRKAPRIFREPRASKSLWPDLTERQAYLYHYCMSS
jgi:hypothetical protein